MRPTDDAHCDAFPASSSPSATRHARRSAGRTLPSMLCAAAVTAVVVASALQTAQAQNGLLTILGPSQTIVDGLYTPEFLWLGSTLQAQVTLSSPPSAQLTLTASCFGSTGSAGESEGISFASSLSFAPGGALSKPWSGQVVSTALSLEAGLERRCRIELSGGAAGEYTVFNQLRYHVVDPAQSMRFIVAQLEHQGTDALRVVVAPKYSIQAGGDLGLLMECAGNGTVLAAYAYWTRSDGVGTKVFSFAPSSNGLVSCAFNTSGSEQGFYGVPGQVEWEVTGYAPGAEGSSTGVEESTGAGASTGGSTGAATRAAGESGCEWASQSYDGSPQELMDALVDAAFNGAPAHSTQPAVVGIFNQPTLRPIFDGSVPVRAGAANSSTVGPDWTVAGSTAQRTLFRHYSQYFGGASLLKCDEQVIDLYEGRTDLRAVHANMPLNESVFSLFISEVAAAAASVGIAGIDIRSLRSMLAGYARSSTSAPIEVCSQADCDCAPGHSGPNCMSPVSASMPVASLSMASLLAPLLLLLLGLYQ